MSCTIICTTSLWSYSVRYEVEIIPTALEMLGKISDRRIRQQIASKIDHLVEDADKQGKPLYGQLVGYRTLRTVGQRYRIIYRIDNGLVIVLVVAIGPRKEGDKKDIYVLAQRLLKLGLLEYEVRRKQEVTAWFGLEVALSGKSQ